MVVLTVFVYLLMGTNEVFGIQTNKCETPLGMESGAIRNKDIILEHEGFGQCSSVPTSAGRIYTTSLFFCFSINGDQPTTLMILFDFLTVVSGFEIHSHHSTPEHLIFGYFPSGITGLEKKYIDKNGNEEIHIDDFIQKTMFDSPIEGTAIKIYVHVIINHHNFLVTKTKWEFYGCPFWNYAKPITQVDMISSIFEDTCEDDVNRGYLNSIGEGWLYGGGPCWLTVQLQDMTKVVYVTVQQNFSSAYRLFGYQYQDIVFNAKVSPPDKSNASMYLLPKNTIINVLKYQPDNLIASKILLSGVSVSTPDHEWRFKDKSLYPNDLVMNRRFLPSNNFHSTGFYLKGSNLKYGEIFGTQRLFMGDCVSNVLKCKDGLTLSFTTKFHKISGHNIDGNIDFDIYDNISSDSCSWHKLSAADPILGDYVLKIKQLPILQYEKIKAYIISSSALPQSESVLLNHTDPQACVDIDELQKRAVSNWISEKDNSYFSTEITLDMQSIINSHDWVYGNSIYIYFKNVTTNTSFLSITASLEWERFTTCYNIPQVTFPPIPETCGGFLLFDFAQDYNVMVLEVTSTFQRFHFAYLPTGSATFVFLSDGSTKLVLEKRDGFEKERVFLPFPIHTKSVRLHPIDCTQSTPTKYVLLSINHCVLKQDSQFLVSIISFGFMYDKGIIFYWDSVNEIVTVKIHEKLVVRVLHYTHDNIRYFKWNTYGLHYQKGNVQLTLNGVQLSKQEAIQDTKDIINKFYISLATAPDHTYIYFDQIYFDNIKVWRRKLSDEEFLAQYERLITFSENEFHLTNTGSFKIMSGCADPGKLDGLCTGQTIHEEKLHQLMSKTSPLQIKVCGSKECVAVNSESEYDEESLLVLRFHPQISSTSTINNAYLYINLLASRSDLQSEICETPVSFDDIESSNNKFIGRYSLSNCVDLDLDKPNNISHFVQYSLWNTNYVNDGIVLLVRFESTFHLNSDYKIFLSIEYINSEEQYLYIPRSLTMLSFETSSFVITADSFAFEFWLFMSGNDFGYLWVFAKFEKSSKLLYFLHENQGHGWKKYSALIPSFGNDVVQIRFVANNNRGYDSQMAIDSIKFTNSITEEIDAYQPINSDMKSVLDYLNLPHAILLYPLTSGGVDISDYGPHHLDLQSTSGMHDFSLGNNKYSFPMMSLRIWSNILFVDFPINLHKSFNEGFTLLLDIYLHSMGSLLNFASSADESLFEVFLEDNVKLVIGNEINIICPTKLEKWKWYFLGLVYSNNNISVYIDNKLDVSVAIQENFNPFSSRFYIANSTESPVFQGYLSCLQIYNVLLSPRQMKSLEFCPIFQDYRFHMWKCAEGGLNVLYQHHCDCVENLRDFANETCHKYGSLYIQERSAYYISFDDQNNVLPKYVGFVPGPHNMAASYNESILIGDVDLPSNSFIQFWFYLKTFENQSDFQEILRFKNFGFFVKLSEDYGSNYLLAVVKNKHSRCFFYVSSEAWFLLGFFFHFDYLKVFVNDNDLDKCMEFGFSDNQTMTSYKGMYLIYLDDFSVKFHGSENNADYLLNYKNGFGLDDKFADYLHKVQFEYGSNHFTADICEIDRLSFKYRNLEEEVCGRSEEYSCRVVTPRTCEIPIRVTAEYSSPFFSLDMYLEIVYSRNNDFQWNYLFTSLENRNLFDLYFLGTTLVIDLTGIFNEEVFKKHFYFLATISNCGGQCERYFHSGQKRLYWEDFEFYDRLYSIRVAAISVRGIVATAQQKYDFEKTAPTLKPGLAFERGDCGKNLSLEFSYPYAPEAFGFSPITNLSTYVSNYLLNWTLNGSRVDDKTIFQNITFFPKPFTNYLISFYVSNDIGSGPIGNYCVTAIDCIPENGPEVTLTDIGFTAAQFFLKPIKMDAETGVGLKYSLLYKLLGTNDKHFTVNMTISHSKRSWRIYKSMFNSTANCSIKTPRSTRSFNVTIENLFSFSNYTYLVRWCTRKGCSQNSTDGLFQTKPTQPSCSFNFYTESINSTSVLVIWENIFGKYCWNGPSPHFRLTTPFQKLNISANSTRCLLNGLPKFHLFRINITLCNNEGCGSSNISIGKTSEDAPDGPPENVTGKITSSTSLLLNILSPMKNLSNGIIRGYRCAFTSKHGTEYRVVAYPSARIDDLMKFTDYNITVRAFTSVGLGPAFTGLVLQTAQDVPDAEPETIAQRNVSHQSIQVEWGEITEDKRNGIIVFHVVSCSGTLPNGTHQIITANVSDAMNYTLTNLYPFTSYVIKVSSCNIVGCSPSQRIALTTSEHPPSSAVVNFTCCHNDLYESICLQWEDVPVMSKLGKIKYFFVVCSLPDSNKTVISFNVSSAKLTTTASGFRNFTLYNCSISPVNSAGIGPKAFASCKTITNVPSEAPVSLSAFNTSSSSIKVVHGKVNNDAHEGVIIGYNVFYQIANCELLCDEKIEVIDKDKYVMELTDLQLHTNYSLSVAGFTSAGPGVRTPSIFVETDTYVNGSWSPWSNMMHCDRSCGGGVKVRYRYCNSPEPARGGANCLGTDSESEDCNTFPCSTYYLAEPGVDCGDTCDRLLDTFRCFPKMETEDSTALFEEAFDALDYTMKSGVHCNVSHEESVHSLSKHPLFSVPLSLCVGYKQASEHFQCESKQYISKDERRLCFCGNNDEEFTGLWSNWGACTKSCGVGLKTRRRNCYSDECKKADDIRNCNIHYCPIDGQWGGWGEWSECDVTCGSGTKTRYRSCNNPTPRYGGKNCPGDGNNVEYIKGCKPQYCPIHGGWSLWEENVACSQPCGNNSVKNQPRFCINPKPQYGGMSCVGRRYRQVPCTNQPPCKEISVTFQARLIDSKWHYTLVYPTSERSRNLTIEFTQEFYSSFNVTAKEMANLRGMIVNAYMKGSVKVNFTLSFRAAPYLEVIFFQNAIDYVGYIGSLRVQMVHTSSLDVPPAPRHMVVTPADPYTVTVSWAHVRNTHEFGTFYLYYIFYRQLDGDRPSHWFNAGTSNNSITLSHLVPDSLYGFRVLVAITTANGIATKQINVKTLSGVPKVAPMNFRYQVYDPRTVNLFWDMIASYEVAGTLSGYEITYKRFNSSEPTISVQTIATIPFAKLKGLRPNTAYSISVVGYTKVGVGPASVGVCRTPPTAPNVPPPNFKICDRYFQDSISFSWDPIPEENENGYLLGYKISYYRYSYRGLESVVKDITRLTVDHFTLNVELNNLTPYSEYKITILAYTQQGDGPSVSKIASTCKCPAVIYTNFYSYPPYISLNAEKNDIQGVFAMFIRDVIYTICTDCLSYVTPALYVNGTKDGYPSEKNSELAMKQGIGDGVHLTQPVHWRFDIETHSSGYPFLGIVQSQGSALIVIHRPVKSTDLVTFFSKILLNWPILLLILLPAAAIAALLWFTEQCASKATINVKSYTRGFLQALWESLITMTTVGYGDYVPFTVLSKIVAVFLILFGVVNVGLFVSSVTSSLTASNIDEVVSLYGTKTAVLYNTYEHRLAIHRNAIISNNFTSVEDVLQAVANSSASVALLDAFLTAEYEKNMYEMNLKVLRIIDTNAGYGLVLSGDLQPIDVELKSFVLAKRAMVDEFVAKKVRKIQPKLQKSETQLISKDSLIGIIIVATYALLGMYVLGSIFTMVMFAKRKLRVNKVECSEVSADKYKELNDVISRFHSSFTTNTRTLSEEQSNQLGALCLLKMRFIRFASRAGLQKKYKDYLFTANEKQVRDILRKYNKRKKR